MLLRALGSHYHSIDLLVKLTLRSWSNGHIRRLLAQRLNECLAKLAIPASHQRN
ncbi:hypothetical protein KSD_15970 [Ktedonobacter sp. SOSP1-85]|nr:hypothetical protein KSD_15970 [Ktedonobacter sp. SOSP1-85]